MSEHVAESDYQQLHYFISDSEWSAEAVMREVASKMAASFESLTGSTGLILDESGNEKAGKKSVGAARQYIGAVPHEDGWAVRRKGNERATSVHNTQSEAIEAAREIAINQQSELFIHRPDGQIRERNPYGNDSNPPKG